MISPKKIAIGLCVVTALLCTWCTPTTETTSEVHSPTDIAPNLNAVVNYLQTVEYAKKWPVFPGNEEGLKRLGLPVHGRWVKTFVNDIAQEYILAAKSGKVTEPFEFPVGSFIVKENYRSNPDATTISSEQSDLKVLTILFKPDPSFNYCATPNIKPYNGTDCLGGGWFYGFHMFDPIPGIDSAVQANVNSFCIDCHAPASNTDYVRTLNDQLHPFSQPGSQSYCEQFLEQPMSDDSALPEQASLPAKKMQAKLLSYCSSSSLSPDLPSDVPIDPNKVFKLLGAASTQNMFDCYAWKTFISLNWPNKPPTAAGTPQRGEPDPNQRFTGTRDGGSAAVWETLKPTFEVFQPNDPTWNPVEQAWNQQPPTLEGENCACDEGEFLLTMSSKSRVANETGQAFAGTFGYLMDRNSKMVRYEVLFNRTEFEYIIADNKAATSNLTPSGPKGVQTKFPDTETDPRKEGSMEIKSAWKELCLGDDCSYSDATTLEEAQKKFYVRKVKIYDAPTKSCRQAWAALVGLHIARKTHFAPQWIWMTFEHKDNVPSFGQTDQQATFFNPDVQAAAECWKLPFLYPKAPVATCPNVDLNRFNPALTNQPNQLTRLVPLQEIAQNQNKKFHQLMQKEGGSPFENYVLVDTQWPLNGRNSNGAISTINCADNELSSDCFKMVPRHLRNTVIESYMSTYCSSGNTFKQYSNRSCMSCHGNAGADFSYIWLDAVSQRINIQ